MSFGTPEPIAVLTDPGCNGGLTRLQGVLVASVCHDLKERRRLALHLSDDDADTWGAPILVDEGAAAYSVCLALDDSTLLLAWEADDYREIRVARINATELGIQSDGTLAPATITPLSGHGAAKPPEVRESIV